MCILEQGKFDKWRLKEKTVRIQDKCLLDSFFERCVERTVEI